MPNRRARIVLVNLIGWVRFWFWWMLVGKANRGAVWLEMEPLEEYRTTGGLWSDGRKGRDLMRNRQFEKSLIPREIMDEFQADFPNWMQWFIPTLETPTSLATWC
ncbi:hypothetical protein E4U55_006953 [Claviceps digitariae]|nr:hypothetical protein E4U55_006953 [Claviceps digitariae]